LPYRFLHIADVHLGRHQHASPERYADYFAALASVVAHALRENVDALLIAGDLFDEQEPSAETLRRAMETLRPLRVAGIDVVAIEGNHDRRKRTEPAGALDLLDSEGYVRLLRPRIEEQTLTLDEYASGSGGALWRPRDGVVIAGLGFLPHNIEEYYAQAAAQLPTDEAVILLAHVMAARDGDALEYGCIAFDDLAPLRERVAYLALGHRHTRMGIGGETDGWIFNPGSLEYVNSLDYHQPAELRGFYDVTLGDEGAKNGLAEIAAQADEEARPDDPVLHVTRGAYRLAVRHVPTEKRPARTLHVDVSGCAAPDEVLAAVRRSADAELDEALRARRPIVIVRLQGAPALSRVRMPRAAIAELLQREFAALHVEVMDRDLLGAAGASLLLCDEGGLEQVADRARAIVADLLRAQGIAHGREDELSAVLLDLKQQLHGSTKTPSDPVLERMREQLRPFVESEGTA
jgi:exonuclease SbcD